MQTEKKDILGWKIEQRQSTLAATADFLQCSEIGTRTKGKVAKINEIFFAAAT